MPAALGAPRLRWRDHGQGHLMDRPRSPRTALATLVRRLRAKALGADNGLDGLLPRQQLSVLYEVLLGRKPDPAGVTSYLPGLQDGTMSASELAEWIYASSEWWTVAPFTQLAPALHFSRSLFVRSLPQGPSHPRPGGDRTRIRQGGHGPHGLPLRLRRARRRRPSPR